MNKLHQEFGDRGLVIVGVSDEGKKQLAKFVEDFEIEYPIARGNNTAYGVRGYPTYVLVHPDGTIVKRGHPSRSEIEELLGAVSMAPPMPDTSRFNPLRKAWAKRKFAEVDKQLTKLGEAELDNEETEAVTELKQRFARLREQTSTSINDLGQGPDYYRAKVKLENITKSWKGLPPAEAAAAELKRFSKDAEIKTEIKAGKQLAAVLKKYGSNKYSDKKKLNKALKALRKKFKGTHAAKRALSLATSR